MTIGQKGNLVVLKVAVSPKSEKPLPPKLVCMHVTLIPTCMNFLDRFDQLNFLMTKLVAVSPKCMHVTSIPTCMNFLGRFRSIKFFDDHGL